MSPSIRVAAILFDLFILYLVVGQNTVRRVLPAGMRLRAHLKDYERLFRHLLHFDRDVLPAARVADLHAAVREIRAVRRTGTREQVEGMLTTMSARAADWVPQPRGGWVKEYFEVFVVVLAVVFGFRSLFLQPFKIPTGSMQPTLYGIHFEHQPQVTIPNPLVRAFGWLNHSYRPVDATVKRAGYIEEIRGARPAIPFFPATIVRIAGIEYRLPGDIETVTHFTYSPKLRSCVQRLRGNGQPLYFEEGEVLVRGRLELGDHLFVDRLSLALREPRRGEVTVFLTDGISDLGGGGLGGRYYVKRLVGLPGDELQVRDHRLYVRAKGQTEFTVLDNQASPAFGRIYTFRGGYRGYCHYPSSAYLLTNKDTFVVPDGQYFMMGDNSENSKDSRFWGTVPRANILGRACLVWWPFSRRWGTIDRVEPLDFPTLPTMD